MYYLCCINYFTIFPFLHAAILNCSLGWITVATLLLLCNWFSACSQITRTITNWNTILLVGIKKLRVLFCLIFSYLPSLFLVNNPKEQFDLKESIYLHHYMDFTLVWQGGNSATVGRSVVTNHLNSVRVSKLVFCSLPIAGLQIMAGQAPVMLSSQTCTVSCRWYF